MKRIKTVNGYAIYQAMTQRDADNYSCQIGSYNLYLSSDIRDYGLANSYPEYDDIDSLAAALELANGSNYAIACALAEELSDSTIQDMDLVIEIERRLDEGQTVELITESYDTDEQCFVEAGSVLTYEEFIDLAKQNYSKGGDGYVECWEEYQFDDYVKLFGAITEKKALEMFAADYEIERENEEFVRWASGTDVAEEENDYEGGSTMQYARFEIEKSVFEAREKSVHLDGMFGDVYAPKSKIIVEGERKPDSATNTFIQCLIPCWVFWNKTFNPVQFTGFVEQINC